MHEMDTGNVGGDTGWSFRLVMLIVTIGGIFISGALIGIINNAIGSRIDNLRKGRSRVLEEGHVLILGWSAQVFTVLDELVAARAHGSALVVVVLAERDSVDMEREIRGRLGVSRRCRVICRTGDPTDLGNLEVANVRGSASIIVLSPEVDDPDASVIKTLLAIVNAPSRRAESYRIVAEIHESSNGQVAAMVGRDEVRLVVAAELISRIAVQTSRQSGLSTVYTELLSFDGSEIYFSAPSLFLGRTFGECLRGFERALPIGIRCADGRIWLRPAMGQRIEEGDRLIALAADRRALVPSESTLPVDEQAIAEPPRGEMIPENTLILGWNRRAPTIINALDDYAASGSTVTVIADASDAPGRLADRCADLRHQTLTVRQGDTTDRRELDRLDFRRFDHVIVLGYSDSMDAQQADSRTLVTLLHLRDLSDKQGYRFTIVGEMCDVRNRQLAEATRADDFIVSDRLVSLMLVQLTENWELGVVFDELFDARGVEFYLRPASNYVELGRPVAMSTVVESVSRCGDVAVGYRRSGDSRDATPGYGVRVNPPGREAVTFGEGDQIIVLSLGTPGE